MNTMSVYAYPGIKDVVISRINNDEQVYSVKVLVAKYYGVTVQSLSMKSRKREIVTARQMAMVLIKNNSVFSLKKIGMSFGGRDHSTVIHAVQTIQDLCFSDQKIRYDYKHLTDQLKHYLITGILTII